MIRNLTITLAIALTAFSVVSVSKSSAAAKSVCPGGKANDCISCHKLSNEEAQGIINFTGATVKSVKHSAVLGLFELLLERDGRKGVVFVDYAKKHVIQGGAMDAKSLKAVVAHEKDLPPPPKQMTGIDLKSTPVQHAVVMGDPKGSKKIYVFTDPDCPYCRQLHPALRTLAAEYKDVAINVMLMPIPSLHPKAYDKARSVMASKDLKALDAAFEGKAVAAPAGDAGKAGVDAIMKFSQSAGINGTPMIFGTDGKILNAARDAASLAKAIGAVKK